MSTCGKMISSGKRRILVDAKEPALVPDLLDALRDEFPGVPVVVHDSAADLASAAMTADMFSPGGWKILVLWDLDEDGVEKVSPLLEWKSEDAVLFVQRKSLPRSKGYTALKGACETVTLEPFDDRGCEAYVAAALKKRGCDFAPEVPSVLVSRVGRDLPSLKFEAKKLSLLGRRVDRVMAERVSARHGDVRIFDFADAILRRRWHQACVMAETAPEGDLIGLLHILQSQCQRLYKAASLKDQGMAADDIASMLEVPAYIARTKIMPLASQMGRLRVLKMLDAIHSADVLARVSRLPKRVLMESVVIKLMKA